MEQSLLLEIRPGTGGEEAALFASDLFLMYKKFALSKNWKINIIDENKTSIGGLKSIAAEIKGFNAYNYLKMESGTHRIQRIPKTEKSGRVHTSTVTVAILPILKKEELKINSDDLKIDFYRSSGAGGQNVNKVSTAVRITHLPTGIVTASQSERSQPQNREKAMQILMSKLKFEMESSKVKELSELRRSQIGTGERAEKIRTYNFPQNRVTDHRVKKNWHNIDDILNGNLEPVIKEFTKFHQK